MATSKTYELMLKIGGKTDSSLKAACTSADKNLATLSDTGAAIGTAVTAGIAIATAAVLAGGKALYDIGSEFDAAYDTIRVGTGATGDALTNLNDSMKAVYSTIPTTMADASTAIADYNTRLGVTDGVLEDLSTKAIQAADILGEDVTGIVEASSTAFQNWKVDVEAMPDAMDYVFKVAQSTGAGFTDLFSNLQTYGSQLQSVGYGFEESAVLLGQVEKAGYDVSTVMTSLKTASAAAASDGFENINDGLLSYIDQIQNAQSETEAYNLATEVFGSKGAATMIDAINSGTLSLSDLETQLNASTETISTAAEATYSAAEKWTILKNKMTVWLEPLATTVFDAMGDTIDKVTPQVEAFFPVVIEGVESVTGGLQTAGQWIGNNTDLILFLATAVGTAVVAYKTYKTGLVAYNAVMAIHKVVTAASATGTFTLAGAMTALNIPVYATIAAFALLVAGGVLLYKNWDTVQAKAYALGDSITGVWGNISDGVKNAIAAIGEHFPLLAGFLEGVWTSVDATWANIQGIFTGMIDFIDNVFAGNWKGAWESIVSIFGNVFGGLGNIALLPVNAVIGVINAAIGEINAISIDVPDWVPIFGGKTYGFDIPKIAAITVPALAEGGIATAATLAQVGEGSEPEAILPLSKLAALLDIDPEGDPKPQPQQPSTPITFAPVLNFYGDSPSKEDVEEAMRNAYKEFKAMYAQLMAEQKRKSFA